MRRLGIIGGMSWESSATYYRLINQGVREQLGPLHSAPLLIDSLDFAEIEACQRRGDWQAAGEILAASARRLEAGGAEGLVLATNTMHKVAGAITGATALPLLHIAGPTGAALAAAGHERVLLLGTAFTMEQAFLSDRLSADHGITCLVPGDEDRAEVHRIIYEELVAGTIDGASRATYVGVIEAGARSGAEAVVFGCTEIGLLLEPAGSPLPVFDTTALHAAAAIDFVLGERTVTR